MFFKELFWYNFRDESKAEGKRVIIIDLPDLSLSVAWKERVTYLPAPCLMEGVVETQYSWLKMLPLNRITSRSFGA